MWARRARVPRVVQKKQERSTPGASSTQSSHSQHVFAVIWCVITFLLWNPCPVPVLRFWEEVGFLRVGVQVYSSKA